MAEVAAVVFMALAAFVVAFQLGLVAGAPWGALTQGGRYPGKLPRPMRVVALASALLLVAFAAVVAARAGMTTPSWHAAARSLIWVVVAYCSIGVLANAVTPSEQERRLWLPVVVIMLVTSVVVALS